MDEVNGKPREIRERRIDAAEFPAHTRRNCMANDSM
jgi:hypothetical protein